MEDNLVRHDHRYRALERASKVYCDPLTILPRQTGMTLQGVEETGFVVYGRAHGGDDIRCLFSTEAVAQAYIDAAQD